MARLTRRRLLATIPAAGVGAAALHAAVPHSHGKGSTAAAATGGHDAHAGRTNRRVIGFQCRGRNDEVEGLVVTCRREGARIRFYANVP